MSVASAFNYCETMWIISVNLIRMEKGEGLLLESGLSQMSTVKTFQAGHATFHFIAINLPSQACSNIFKLSLRNSNVQQVVHASGSSMYVIDLEESVDHGSDPSSGQHREPALFVNLFGLSSSLER